MHLRIDDIAKSWGGHTVLDHVSFNAGENEFVCLLGPSGCGKTTLLRLVAGLTAPGCPAASYSAAATSPRCPRVNVVWASCSRLIRSFPT